MGEGDVGALDFAADFVEHGVVKPENIAVAQDPIQAGTFQVGPQGACR